MLIMNQEFDQAFWAIAITESTQSCITLYHIIQHLKKSPKKSLLCSLKIKCPKMS